MAIVLTCHLIETIWSNKDTGMRAPFMVIDHNGQQHQTEVMKAGAVTVWNTKATFPYAPSSDLVVMAFDAAGRQPGSFIAQAVVDVAVMLQEGSLNATAALVNRKGVNVGVVLFDVGLVTSSRALAAGLDIPSLTYSNQSCPDSPAGRTNQPVSPTAAATGRNSPFAQLAVQHGLAQHGAAGDIQPSTPSTAQSMGSKLVGSISQALVGALLGLETRDRVSEFEQGSSSSGSPKRLGAQSRSLDCSPTRQAVQQPRGSPHAIRSAAGQKAAVSAAGVGAGGGNSSSRDPTSVSLHRRRSTAQHVQQAANVEQPQSLPTGLLRSSTGMSSGLATAPLASERASFSAWGQAPPINRPLTAGRPIASASGHAAAGSSAAAAVQGAQRIARSISANGMGHLIRSSSTTGRSGSPQTAPAAAAAAAAAADSSMQGSPSSRASRTEDRRPSRLTVPAESSSSGSTSPNPGSNRTLSPLTEARARLRLPRPQAQPLPPLAQLFSHTSTQPDGLIPVGRAPASPAGYSEATTARFSCGTAVEMSADYDALLREFDAADAAGKEAILFRELMQQQQERQSGCSQLLNVLTQQQQQELLEHKQLMDALEDLSNSPTHSPPRTAGDAFRSCFSSSTQITSGSSGSNNSSSNGSTGSARFKHYPNLPEFTAGATAVSPPPAAAAAAAARPSSQLASTMQRPPRKHNPAQGSLAPVPAGFSASPEVRQGPQSPTVQSPVRPAAEGLLEQLSSAECEEAGPLFSARQGHKLLGDRVGQQGSRSAQSSPMSAAAAEADAAAVRQLNWQLLERMTQQEMAAAAAAVPVASYPISHAGTDISDRMFDASIAPDISEPAAAAAAAAKPHHTATVSPAFTCKKTAGQLTGYSTSSTSDQAAAKKASSCWVAPVRDAAPYSKPPPAFPFVAVPVEPSAPLMTVPEEYPCA